MRAISGRRFGRGVLFVSIFAGYAADGFGQEYIREFYPYQRDAEAYAPMLQTDTALFYRAVQTAPDLYGANTDYNLPMVAVGRRGRTYTDESTLLNGMPIENYRTCALLRILGTSEETYPGATAPEAGLRAGRARETGKGERGPGGQRAPPGPRPAHRRSIHRCVDGRSTIRQTILGKSQAGNRFHRAAFDTRRTLGIDHRSFPADGRPALQPRMGIAELQGAQLSRTS